MTAQPPVRPGDKVKIQTEDGRKMRGIVTKILVERQGPDPSGFPGLTRTQLVIELDVPDAQGEILR